MFRKGDGPALPRCVRPAWHLQDIFRLRSQQLSGRPSDFPLTASLDEEPVFSIRMRVLAAIDPVVRVRVLLFLLRRFGAGHPCE